LRRRKNGAKNIVHFSGPQNFELYKRRLGGYKSALDKYGIEIRENYILESKLMRDDGVESIKKALQLPKVDAVFSANDVSAIAAMQYLKNKWRSISHVFCPSFILS